MVALRCPTTTARRSLVCVPRLVVFSPTNLSMNRAVSPFKRMAT